MSIKFCGVMLLLAPLFWGCGGTKKISYWENGNKKSEYWPIGPKKDTFVYKQWDPKARILEKGYYLNGEKDGDWNYWDYSGEYDKTKVERFKHGQLKLIVEDFGEKQQTTIFDKNERDSLKIEVHAIKNYRDSLFFAEGKFNTKIRRGANGQILFKEEVVGGDLWNRKVTFFENERVEEKYFRGEFLLKKVIKEQGVVTESKSMDTLGRLHGPYIKRLPQGNLVEQGEYKSGKRDNAWIFRDYVDAKKHVLVDLFSELADTSFRVKEELFCLSETKAVFKNGILDGELEENGYWFLNKFSAKRAYKEGNLLWGKEYFYVLGDSTQVMISVVVNSEEGQNTQKVLFFSEGGEVQDSFLYDLSVPALNPKEGQIGNRKISKKGEYLLNLIKEVPPQQFFFCVNPLGQVKEIELKGSSELSDKEKLVCKGAMRQTLFTPLEFTENPIVACGAFLLKYKQKRGR